MSGIGGINTGSVTGASTTASATAGTAATAPITLKDPRLAPHATALAGVRAGTAQVNFGASGAHVKAIQEALVAAGYPATPQTGTFDRSTQQKVSLFQRRHNLPMTGNIDKATLAALDTTAVAHPPRPATGGTGTTTPTAPTTTTPTPPTQPGRPVITTPTTPVTPTAPVTGPDPLAGRLYMDSKTFASMPSYQWARDSVELESVMGVKGVESKALLDALRATNSAGRTTYQRLRKPEFANAFTLGYGSLGLDDMRWDSDSHKLREKSKFVSLTVEDGRYEPDAATGAREVTLGTDKMDDTYYDTANNDLTKNGFSVRGRARWDTDTEIRRILVGVKANSTVDEFGIKSCDKTDIRNDGASAAEIAALDKDVRTGNVSWSSSGGPIKPLKGVYDALAAKGVLPDVGPHEDVLELQPKVHIRSVRSRYHMNETELADIRKLYAEAGAPKIQAALDLATKAKAGTLSAPERAAVDALERSARELLAMPKMPERGSGWQTTPPASFDELEKDRQLSEQIDAKYHAFAEQLDGARRVLAGARQDTYEGHAKMFAGWQKSVDKTLQNKGTFDPFLAKYDAMTAADMTTFNDYGNAQKAAGNRDFRDFTVLDASGWKELRPAILNETIRIQQRQIEAAGSAARSLWFDEARAFYVPTSHRNTSNFIIDTFDMSEYVKHADWESIPAASRTPANALPKDKIFHASLVAEAQIELGCEKPYMDRLKELKAGIDGDRASMVMKWMDAGGRTGIDRNNPATYATALTALKALPARQLDAEVRKINDFLKAQGSVLKPLKADDLKRLDGALLTAANRDKAVRKDAAPERNLDGALFVFNQYLESQKMLSEVKGDRALKILRDAGAPRTMTWETTDASKGDTALKLVAGNR